MNVHEHSSHIKKLRDQARHFSAVHSNRVNYDKFLQENLDLPGSSIQVDLNGTRMSSVHGLIRSSLRIKRTLTNTLHHMTFLFILTMQTGNLHEK